MLNNLVKKKSIIILSGATATGKSKIAIEIAKNFNGVIINADAMQVYQDLPILSAQPSKDDLNNHQHFLYGFLSAIEKMSVANWLNLVEKILADIHLQNKLPIVVGGTGMYISRLIDGIAEIPQIDKEINKKVNDLYQKIGHQEFVKKFGNEKIIDKQKLLRRAEIFMQTGKNIEYFLANNQRKILENYQILHVNLNLERDEIYQNCNNRFDNMLENSAIDEVKFFLQKYPNYQNYSIAKTLGLQEIIDYLCGKITIDEMKNFAKQKTRNFAKRQLTWFRHQFSQIYFCQNQQQILSLVKNFLNHEIF
jgi:tRNA dimethylallyltransferase